MSKINIVHIIFLMKVGGAENMLADLVNEQVNKANVTIIIVNDQFDKMLLERISPKVKVYYAGRKEGSRNPFIFLKIWHWVLRHKADVIHCHQHNLVNFLPFWKHKTVITIHTVGVRTENLKKYKKVFSISAAVMQDLLTRGGLNSTLIYNGIQTTFIKTKTSQDYNASPLFKIVQVSRLRHEIKGQHLAIEAIHKLRELTNYNIQLYLIGTGPSLQFLKELIKKYKLEECVIFLGEKERNWIYDNLYQYDLLLQPSINEGFGLTIVEGLAAGLPAVASNIGGPAEILQDIPAGFLFDMNRQDDLAFTIKKVIELTKANKMHDLCEISRTLVCQKFSINQTVTSYLTSYPVMNPNPATLIQL